jgi:hypothetical protein
MSRNPKHELMKRARKGHLGRAATSTTRKHSPKQSAPKKTPVTRQKEPPEDPMTRQAPVCQVNSVEVQRNAISGPPRGFASPLRFGLIDSRRRLRLGTAKD